MRFEQQEDGSATVTFERTAEAAPAVAVVAEVKEGDDGAFRLQVSLQVTEAPPAVAADVVDVAVNEGEDGFGVDVSLDESASRIQEATRESIAGADADDAASRIQTATRVSIAGAAEEHEGEEESVAEEAVRGKSMLG